MGIRSGAKCHTHRSGLDGIHTARRTPMPSWLPSVSRRRGMEGFLARPDALRPPTTHSQIGFRPGCLGSDLGGRATPNESQSLKIGSGSVIIALTSRAVTSALLE